MKKIGVISIILALAGCASDDLDRSGYTATNRAASRNRAMVKDIGSVAKPNITFDSGANTFSGEVNVGLAGGYKFDTTTLDSLTYTDGNVNYLDGIDVSGGPLDKMKEDFIALFKTKTGTALTPAEEEVVGRLFDAIEAKSLSEREEILAQISEISKVKPGDYTGDGYNVEILTRFIAAFPIDNALLLELRDIFSAIPIGDPKLRAFLTGFIESVNENSKLPMLHDPEGRVAVWNRDKPVVTDAKVAANANIYAGYTGLKYSGFGYVSVRDFDASYGAQPVGLDYHGFTYGDAAHLIGDAADLAGARKRPNIGMAFTGSAIGGINQLKAGGTQISAELAGTSKFYLNLANPLQSFLQLDFYDILGDGNKANSFGIRFDYAGTRLDDTGAKITTNFGKNSDFARLVPVTGSGKYEAKLYGANGNPTEVVGSFRYKDNLTIIGGAFGGVKTAQVVPVSSSSRY